MADYAALLTQASEPSRPVINALADVEKLIASKAPTHGEFEDYAYLVQAFKQLAHASRNWQNLNSAQAECVDHLLGKLGRVLTGDPNHAEHAIDIQGYGHLLERACGQ